MAYESGMMESVSNVIKNSYHRYSNNNNANKHQIFYPKSMFEDNEEERKWATKKTWADLLLEIQCSQKLRTKQFVYVFDC